MVGGIYIKAKGLGILIRKPYFPKENLLKAADNLIYVEDKNGKSLFQQWKYKK